MKGGDDQTLALGIHGRGHLNPRLQRLVPVAGDEGGLGRQRRFDGIRVVRELDDQRLGKERGVTQVDLEDAQGFGGEGKLQRRPARHRGHAQFLRLIQQAARHDYGHRVPDLYRLVVV
jgi:hypothetical protein